MLLALDTSTRLVGIALYDEWQLIAEYTWHSAQRHTVELMPAVARLLAQADVTATALRAVAVALGPGSFTGVRVGMAAAKGLAVANSAALLGVPTLDAAAYPYRRGTLPVLALAQAGRGRLYWALYPPAASRSAGPPATGYHLSTIVDLAEAVQQTDEPVLVTGELLPATRAALVERLGSQAECLPPALAMRRAGYLAELAWQRFAAGQADNVDALSPIYLQEPGRGKGV